MALRNTTVRSEGHVERLEEVFRAPKRSRKARTCDAIVGITEEGAEIMTEYEGTPTGRGLWRPRRRSALPISRYVTLKAWAEKVGIRSGGAS